MILSILICTMPKRKAMLDRLFEELLKQIQGKEVEIIADSDMTITTGTKRNKLLGLAKGKYVVFIDDDDTVSIDYVNSIMAALASEPDAVGFKGWITTNGRNRMVWKISKDFPYMQKGGVYLRYNNHLSPMKKSIAMAIGYPDSVFGEDYDFAFRLHQSGLIQTEVFIDKFLYNYDYKTRK